MLRNLQGFSLTELAIAIVVIGLLMGAVSGGSRLIQQAEMKALIADMEQYKSDYYKFKTEYSAVAGDMVNASTFFANCASGGIGNINCDGNGDGFITFNMGNGFNIDNIGDELVKFHRHLNLAGINNRGGNVIIPSNYSSVGSVGNDLGYYPVGNVKSSTLAVATVDGGSTGGSELAVGTIALGGGLLISNFEPFVTIVFVMKLGSNSNIAGVITPLQAFQIDKKIDDADEQSANATGASTGLIRTINDIAVGGCVSGNNYLVSVKNESCILQMKIK